jgi:hypothetical protein
MHQFQMKHFFTATIILSMFLSSLGFAENMPAENKKAVKEMNDLLVNYFKDNCKGKDYSSTCPILKELVPNGKFNTMIAKDYVKNYHFWVFNDHWIWVGHGLFNKLIGKNHKDFQGADGKYFAQGFREFVDQHEQGYYPYVEMKAGGGYKSTAYLHRLVFSDNSELIFATGYNIPYDLWDKKILKDMGSEN